MSFFSFFKLKKRIPAPMIPNPELTEAEKREVAAILGGEKQLKATLEILHEKAERRRETSRSIRG